jgi:aminoglycoside 3-N-acetyltransferase
MNRAEIVQLLAPLALRDNQVIVHTALSSFAGTETSPLTICEALMEAVGPGGTLVMPAFTYSETLFSDDEHPPVAFRSDSPVSAEIGAVAETFRLFPGVLRGSHPSHSFACAGRQAREMLSTQRDNNPLGPLKKLNLLQGHTLLLGTGLRAAVVGHLAEEMAAHRYLLRTSALRMNASGFVERVVLEHVPGCSVAFDRLESRLDREQILSVRLPHGVGRKIPIRYLVRLATDALTADPLIFACDRADCRGCAGKRAAVSALTATA